MQAIAFETPRLRLRNGGDGLFPALVDRAASDADIAAWKQQLAERGWSNWAVELRKGGDFIRLGRKRWASLNRAAP